MNRDQWQKLPGKEKLRRKAAIAGGTKRLCHASLSAIIARDASYRPPPPVTLPRVPFQEKD